MTKPDTSPEAVERLSPVVVRLRGSWVASMDTDPDGDFVLRADYETLQAERDALAEASDDKRRLTRDLDIALHGEENAAPQASLCDLIAPARELRREHDILVAMCKSFDAKAARLQAEVLHALGCTKAAEAEVSRLREALTLIERLYYIEGKDAEWRAVRMNAVARDAQDGNDLGHYRRIFPRAHMGQTMAECDCDRADCARIGLCLAEIQEV